MRSKKRFDAVKMMRDVRKKAYAPTRTMDFEQLKKYIGEEIEKGAAALTDSELKVPYPKSAKRKKKFDAVKMMRDIRDKISLETKNMNLEELRAYFEKTQTIHCCQTKRKI